MVVNWRMMFCEIISVIVRSFLPIYSKFLKKSLYINQCHFISHVFERLGFILQLTNTYVVGLYVLRGVAGYLWSNAIKFVHMQIDIFHYGMFHMFHCLLLKIPPLGYSCYLCGYDHFFCGKAELAVVQSNH